MICWFRAVGRSENLERQMWWALSVPLLIQIGLTDLPKSGASLPPIPTDLNWKSDKFSERDYCLTGRYVGRQQRFTDKRTDVWSRDFIIWKINSGLWAVVWAGLWNKRVWADYEQLLRPVFSLFRGQKKILKIFWKHHSVRTEKLHWKKVKKKNLGGDNFFFQKNHFYLGLKMPL